MKQLLLYKKWLSLHLAELNTSDNRRWFVLYLLFCISGFLGVHLVFLKKYKRAMWYLISWILIAGSYIATFYRPVPFQFFFIGLLLLAIVFLIDIFNVYLFQTRRLKVYLPFILLLLFFCAQVFLYEYIAQENSDFIREKVLSVAGRFRGIN